MFRARLTRYEYAKKISIEHLHDLSKVLLREEVDGSSSLVAMPSNLSSLRAWDTLAERLRRLHQLPYLESFHIAFLFKANASPLFKGVVEGELLAENVFLVRFYGLTDRLSKSAKMLAEIAYLMIVRSSAVHDHEWNRILMLSAGEPADWLVSPARPPNTSLRLHLGKDADGI